MLRQHILVGSAALLIAAASLIGCGSSDNSGNGQGGGGAAGAGGSGDVPDPSTYLHVPKSCAYLCGSKCAEDQTPYACPAMADWAALPHAQECPSWDGTYPASHQGKCTASAPSGDAAKEPGEDPDQPGTRILPDGHLERPAGAFTLFQEAEARGGTTSGIASVPGTSFVITVDTGTDDHALRVVDTTKIGSPDAVTSFINFTGSKHLGSDIAYVAPDRVYVPTSYGVIQKLAFDASTGALQLDDADSIKMPVSKNASGKPAEWYSSCVAANPSGTLLVVGSVTEERVLVFDIDPQSATHNQELGEVEIGSREAFGVWFDPFDPSGRTAYLTVWGGRKVLEIDVSNPAAPVVSRTFQTDHDPQTLAFLDARWVAVANDLGETISLIDRTSGTVTSVPVDYEPGLHGLDVSGVAYDSNAKRLYAALSGINAIAAYDVDLSKAPPTLTPAGRIPTAWWPGGLVTNADGSLTVASLRGNGIGPYPEVFAIGAGDGHQNMRGGVQQIPAPSASDLAEDDAFVHKANAVGDRSGAPAVDCAGGESDFPVPQTNTEGPSPVIKNVIFVVRENKDFDSLLGDISTVDGDPSLTMKASSADMEKVWPNFRDLVRTFATSDNFYNVAVQSVQGHTWTTYGRTTDYDERTWGDSSRWAPLSGIDDIGRPDEGSLFDWLQNNDIVYDILGEVVGVPSSVPSAHNPIDTSYPGGPFQNIPYNDVEKACYAAARVRVVCNLGSFVYMTLPNDHTIGVSPLNPSPETMCAVNDEATGMLIDAVSHSPIWASTLVIVTEDDPQQGGDHVDYHRTPIAFISPWVKRAYVSKTHTDVASLHKLFAHIFGKPYSNLIVKNAALPIDLFTSTPDYTPYTYKPRVWQAECGKDSTRAERTLTESWDFSHVDEQPGLGEQVMRWMRRRQLQQLTPGLREQIEQRKAGKASDDD